MMWKSSRQEVLHKRLGHPNFKAMEVMDEKGLVLGLPSSLPSFCQKFVSNVQCLNIIEFIIIDLHLDLGVLLIFCIRM